MIDTWNRYVVWTAISYFLVTYLHQCSSAEPDLAYTFLLKRGPAIEVTIHFTGNSDGETNLQVAPEWGGIVNDGSDVNDLTVLDANGQAVPLEQTAPTVWQVRHENGARLTARYEIRPPGAREPNRNGNDYRTRFDANLFQAIGNLAILMPQVFSENQNVYFQVSFRGFDEIGWRIVSSFGLGAGPFAFTSTCDKFLQSVLMAGNLDIQERWIGEHRIAVAVAGRVWSFETDKLANWVEQIVRAERDFFSDHTDPWYLVTLTPLPASHPGSSSFGGTAVTNCFALYCTPNLNLDPASPDFQRTMILLAHEYFHNWNGIKIPTAGKDPSTYWFSEGFTNYFARRVLFRAGLITAEQFLADLNSALRAYESNEFKLATNAVIAESFWSNHNVRDLPYRRGDMLAVFLDEQIRTQSEGRQSLDDLIVDLFRNPIAEHPMTTELLLDRISQFVDETVFDQIRQVVVAGAEVPIPTAIAEPALTLKSAQARSYDPGFDLEKSRDSKIICGVRESSEAWLAGLRDGQTLQRYSLQNGNGAPTAEVVVLIDGEAKKIEYTPLSAPQEIRVYQFPSESQNQSNGR